MHWHTWTRPATTLTLPASPGPFQALPNCWSYKRGHVACKAYGGNYFRCKTSVTCFPGPGLGRDKAGAEPLQAEPSRAVAVSRPFQKPGSGFDKPGPSREAAALERLDGMGEAALGGSTAPRHSAPAPRVGNLDKALKVQMRDEKGVFHPAAMLQRAGAKAEPSRSRA
ncbi:hypothetical protein JB92DRAFT_2837255 [Gautieria morchelliformis]|nr:hypothetical protein JB92DRAFT_2837255 [Gautieria morchelliformis]